MTTELMWIVAFNLIVNGFLVFFTSVLLCKFLIFVFRIQSPRLRSLIYLLPLLKLVLDFVLYYDFSNWALFHEIDPRYAEENSRSFGFYLGIPWPLAGLTFTILDKELFTLADLLALFLGPVWTKVIVSLVFSISILSLIHWFKGLYRSKKIIKQWIEKSIPLKRAF